MRRTEVAYGQMSVRRHKSTKAIATAATETPHGTTRTSAEGQGTLAAIQRVWVNPGDSIDTLNRPWALGTVLATLRHDTGDAQHKTHQILHPDRKG